MMLLSCPHCGPRDAAEFAYVGERTRRPDPNTATARQWRSYLYLRRNPAGWADELWFHRTGCRRYLAVRRHTVTGEFDTVHDVREASTGGDD
jgi:sarcosine oxidase, subunit delta